MEPIQVFDDLVDQAKLDDVMNFIYARGYRYGWHSNKQVIFSHWNLGFSQTGADSRNRKDIRSELPEPVQNSYINIFNGIATLLNIISSFTGKIDLNKPTSGNSVDLENQVDYYTGILNEIENFITTLRTLESETAAIPPTLLFPGMNADQSFLYLEDTIRQLDNYEDGINMEIGYLKKLLGP